MTPDAYKALTTRLPDFIRDNGFDQRLILSKEEDAAKDIDWTQVQAMPTEEFPYPPTPAQEISAEEVLAVGYQPTMLNTYSTNRYAQKEELMLMSFNEDGTVDLMETLKEFLICTLGWRYSTSNRKKALLS